MFLFLLAVCFVLSLVCSFVWFVGLLVGSEVLPEGAEGLLEGSEGLPGGPEGLSESF